MENIYEVYRFQGIFKVLFGRCNRKDKTYCEIELSDGNNIFIEKRNGKYIFNCTKSLLTFSKEEIDELNKMLKDIK